MEDGGSVTILVDAKEEYTKQLVSILRPCIYQGIKSIYLDSKDIANQENTPENVLMIFQDQLSRIPKWSQEIINKEYQRIIDSSRCDYIEDLLKVVYVSHIKILTIVHSAQRNKKITLKVPSGSHFMHLCYIECAREFWKNPYLFSDRTSKYEHQKNMRDSENMIAECIAETIRKQLPVRHILKEYLNEPDEEVAEVKGVETGDEEDIKNPINKKYLKRLETMVKKELATLAASDEKEKESSVSDKQAAAATTNSAQEVENQQQQAIKETIKSLDEDMIRRIIKEEMESRLREGKASDAATTVTPKKETVNEVVEKIIEQVEEQIQQNSGTTSVSTAVITAEEEETPKVVETVEPPTTHPESPSIQPQEMTPKTEEIDEKSNNSSTPAISEDKTPQISTSTEGTGPTQSQQTLKISDVDEINLNLDELDDHIDEPVKDVPEHSEDSIPIDAADEDELITDNLDDLEELDLKTVAPSQQKNEGEKGGFSFFKDAVKSIF